MKKIKLLISLLLINFSVYSQTIPTAEQFLNFLKENNYTCNSIDYEEFYSNYGYDVEDDVSELIDAIDSYCKYLIPNFFEEFQKIRTANDNLIKTLKKIHFVLTLLSNFTKRWDAFFKFSGLVHTMDLIV